MLSGECLLVVEGEERRLAAWGYGHCPGGTEHVIVGAGHGAAIVVAVGARGGRKGVTYEVSPAALSHGAGVEEQTTSSADAYRRFPRPTRSPYRDGWLPTR